MQRRVGGVVFFLYSTLLVGVMPAVAQGNGPSAHPAGPARLADLAWLEGNWQGETKANRFTAEESWLPAQGGAMVGMFRLLDPRNGNRVLVLEFITLRETPEGVEMRLRHFDTALAPLDKGDALWLKLASADGTRFTFENPVHTRPKRTIFERVGNQEFTVRSEIVFDTGEMTVHEVALQRSGLRGDQNPAAPVQPRGAAASRRPPR